MQFRLNGRIAGLLAIALAASSVSPTFAQATAEQLGTFSSWTAWRSSDANGVICYISARPETAESQGRPRGPISFLVIHRKGLGTKNEVQTLIGYTFGPDAKPTAAVDGRAYPMITEAEAGWLASTSDEPAFVAAMKKGSSLVVKGTSSRGTPTTDTYSLKGVTAAMTEIDRACA